MEYVNGALKSNLSSPEMVLKPAYREGFMEDLCYAVDGNVAENGTVSDDDFFVDELLDFSKAEGEEEEEHVYAEEKASVEKSSSVVCFSPVKAENFGSFSKSVTESELCVPADELAHLEWLSNFVDDSAPGYSLTITAEKLTLKTTSKLSDEENPGDEKSTVTAPVQTKARSKRGRSGVKIWPLSESSTSSSSSSHTTSSPLSPWVMYDIGHSAESLFGKPPAKKHKKQAHGDSSGGGAQPRRCSHCLVQKTPQWRAGPQGAKTLCNACGVRYKSGRLLPEYRPACSPTFSSEIHSNNHRKVLEMRRKKESDEGFGTPVESF